MQKGRNIENIKQGDYDFSSIGKFNKNMLMNNCRIEINDNIINTYKELEKNKRDYAIKSNILSLETDEEEKFDLNGNIRKSFCNICEINNISLKDGIDMVIRYTYSKNKNSKKDFLFNIFGDIIFNNLKSNIKKPLGEEYIMCECCGERVERKANNQQYCEKCAKKIKQEQTNKVKRENRRKKDENL